MRRLRPGIVPALAMKCGRLRRSRALRGKKDLGELPGPARFQVGKAVPKCRAPVQTTMIRGFRTVIFRGRFFIAWLAPTM
jgi:hypothetical protein